MSNGNYGFGDYNYQIDPELLKKIQSQSVPELQMPGTEMTPGDLKSMQPRSDEEMRKKLRENLMQRLSDYNPGQLESEKKRDLEDVETSGWSKAASIIGSMLSAGAGKPQFVNLKKDEAARKSAISKEYAGKKAEHQKDLDMFQKFDAMDKQQQMQELQSAKMLQDMKISDLNMKLKNQAYGDAQAARDPNSAQSQFARQTVKDVFEIDIPETTNAIQLKSYMDKAPEMMKQKSVALLKEKQKAEAPTEGEKVTDREFAKDKNEWEARGKASYEKNLKKLKDAKAALEKRKDEFFGPSGKRYSLLPDVAEKFLMSEDNRNIRDTVQSSAFSGLRATLGAQFTENEGKRILGASYDETLSPEKNIERIDAAIKELETNAKIMQSRADYFGKNRSLRGWKAPKGETVKTEKTSTFPMQVRKDGKIATVQNEQELEEARSEGWN